MCAERMNALQAFAHGARYTAVDDTRREVDAVAKIKDSTDGK